MKAMVLESYSAIEDSPLRWAEIPLPEPKESEVRVKIKMCGICRTDLHLIEGELSAKKLPIVPGHQIVGVVDKIGYGCKLFQIGQRIGIAWLRWTCGECELCKAGKENLCPASKYTGYDNDGGYAEYSVINENYAYPIPDQFTDQDAVPLLCAGIVGYRALQRSLLPAGGSLAIFGFGSSAHMIVQIALHQQCRVCVITRGKAHQDLARQMGVHWVGENTSTLPEKVDSAIIFAPNGELIPEALLHLKRGGTVSLAGIHMSDVPMLNYSKHLFFERNIHSVTANTRNDGINFLKEATQIKLHPRTKLYSLQEANRALQDLKNDRISGTGILVI